MQFFFCCLSRITMELLRIRIAERSNNGCRDSEKVATWTDFTPPSTELTFEWWTELCRGENLEWKRHFFNPFDICNKACLPTQVKGKHLMLVAGTHFTSNLLVPRKMKKSAIASLIKKFYDSRISQLKSSEKSLKQISFGHRLHVMAVKF